MRPSLLRQNISYIPIIWRPHHDTLTVLRGLSESIARKRDFVSAQLVFQRLHSCTAFGDLETERSADPILLVPRGPTHAPGPRPLVSAWCPLGTRAPSVSLLLGLSCCSWPRSLFVLLSSLAALSRSEQLRQLAVQLASLASLLEPPTGLVAPISFDERALLASPSRPRSRSHSTLTQGCPPPAPRLHPAQPARPHWPGCQELSSCTARALCSSRRRSAPRHLLPRSHLVHLPRRGC